MSFTSLGPGVVWSFSRGARKKGGASTNPTMNFTRDHSQTLFSYEKAYHVPPPQQQGPAACHARPLRYDAVHFLDDIVVAAAHGAAARPSPRQTPTAHGPSSALLAVGLPLTTRSWTISFANSTIKVTAADVRLSALVCKVTCVEFSPRWSWVAMVAEKHRQICSFCMGSLKPQRAGPTSSMPSAVGRILFASPHPCSTIIQT